MNEIWKHKIRRLLASAGIRFQKYAFYKFPYDRTNFSELCQSDPHIIFDVGANIGQTAIWLKHEFPNSRIFCFEPFHVVYSQLDKNIRNKNISTHQLALGKEHSTMKVRSVHDPLCQTGRIYPGIEPSSSDFEEIEIRTVDEMGRILNINRIDILKSDTEGFDLNVLEGAKGYLQSGSIGNVLVEASIDPLDKDHSNLFEMLDFLRPYGMELYSLYDLNHNHSNGRLQYFNALFKKQHS